MNISQAAEACGLPVKTLRYYESLGLVVPHRQEGNDYREYCSGDIERLRFLQRGRAAGFSLDECRQLLHLHNEGIGHDSCHRQWLQERVDSLDARMHALETMRQSLMSMLAGNQTGNQQIEAYQGGMPFMLVDNRK